MAKEHYHATEDVSNPYRFFWANLFFAGTQRRIGITDSIAIALSIGMMGYHRYEHSSLSTSFSAMLLDLIRHGTFCGLAPLMRENYLLDFMRYSVDYCLFY